MWEHDDIPNYFFYCIFKQQNGRYLESKKILAQIFHPPPNFLFEEYIPLSNVGNNLRISKAKPNMSAIHCMVANTCSQGQGSGTQSQNPNNYLASVFKMKD